MENGSLINGADYQNRIKHLLACIPDIFDYKTALYVGAGPRLQVFDKLIEHNYIVDVVEVFLPNIIKLKDVKRIRTIFCSDIRYFTPKTNYDVVVFWHGIEHLEKSDVYPLTVKMQKYTNKIILFGMPYGRYDQGELYNNPYEKHISAWYPEDFPARGFECDTIGLMDTKRANLIAWKRM